MRTDLLIIFVTGIVGLIMPCLTYAEAYSVYYGVYQHPYEPFQYVSRMRNGVYGRQNNAYISSYTQAIFSERNGYPPVEGENWKFELFDSGTNESLGYVTYSYSGECLYVDAGSGDLYLLGCLADPAADYSFHFIGTFFTKCLETKPYHITASHSGVTAPDDAFEPTRFQPTNGEIIRGSLASIPPVLPDEAASFSTLAVLVNDDLNCNVPLQDIPLSVSNTVVPQSGSHKHFLDDNEIGTGKYVVSIPPWTSSDRNDTSISGMTDQEGLFTANYQAGVFGVKEKVTVTVTNPDTTDEHVTYGDLEIKIPGLEPLNADSGPYVLLGSYGSTCDIQHNDSAYNRRSHYLKTEVLLGVESVANEYFSRINAMLSFNDASLTYGGFFDRGTQNRAERCHVSHRQGIDIDVNKIDTEGNNLLTDFVIGENGAPERIISRLRAFVKHENGRRITEPYSIHFRFDR